MKEDKFLYGVSIMSLLRGYIKLRSTMCLQQLFNKHFVWFDNMLPGKGYLTRAQSGNITYTWIDVCLRLSTQFVDDSLLNQMEERRLRE